MTKHQMRYSIAKIRIPRPSEPKRSELIRTGVTFLVSLSLAGCPGGWREKMISTNSPEPVPPDALATYHGRGAGKAIAPGYMVNEQLYVQMFSVNLHDLSFKYPPDTDDYLINGLISATEKDVSIDTRSFTLLREGYEPVAVARIISTHERPLVTAFGHKPRTACGFWSGHFEIKEPYIQVPVFNNREPWPPENIDDSVVCLSLEFDVSTREVPPQKQFQLRFTYSQDDEDKTATIYFYPLKYTIFEH